MLMGVGWHNKIFKIFKIVLFITVGSFISTVFVFSKSENIDNFIPFTSQAPLFEWNDPRQQDACEEASVLMSISWIYNIPVYSQEMWRDRIVALAEFQQDNYGENRDTSLEDTSSWIFEDYFEYNNTKIINIDSPLKIIEELEKGNILLIPTNGQELKNPNFSGEGPERHMVLVKGYDYENEEFITNDPGTRNGKDYRYNKDLLFKAIRIYKTGYHIPF